MTSKTLLSALFGAALAAAPVSAQDNKTPDNKTPEVKSPELGKVPEAKGADPAKPADAGDAKKAIEDIKVDVKALQTFRKDLEDAVFGKGDGKSVADAGILKRLTELEAKLKTVTDTLNRIEAKLGEGSKSTSGFGNPAPGSASTTGKASVRVINDYPIETSLLINGKSHRLKPGETKTVEVASGEYTYELLTPGASAVKSALKEGETVTLRIR